MNLFENDIKAFLPEIFLTTAILVILVYGVIYSTSPRLSRPNLTTTVAWLSILSLVITGILIINNPFNSMLILKNLLIIDNLTSFVKIVLLLSCAACIVISLDFLKEEKIHAFEYTILMLLATLGMVLMTSSYDFISMYLAIELQSLSLYVLAAFQRNSNFSTEAGLKYFILGALSSGILLFGCSMIYGFTGSTNFGEIATVLTGIGETSISDSRVVLIGIIFIAVALLFKLAAAPFHMWAPDVYEGAPTSVTAFFAIVPKIAIFALFIRLFFYSFYDFIEQWQQVLVICSMMSMVLATLAALYQNKIKRLLAYSAIGHVGYMLVGFSTGTLIGFQALLLYLIIYIIMGINSFSIVLSLRKEENNNSKQITYISDLAGLGKTNPLLAISFAIVLFSMAGIPPLAGFYGKMYIFLSAIESEMYLLALVGVLTSVVGCVYYIRLIKIMYFEQPNEAVTFKTVDLEKTLVIGITSLFIIFFFIYPNPLLTAAHKAALTLCL